MTGNITRGRHFRGDSPLGSTTDFGSQLGSSSLDGFLRDSVGVDDIRSRRSTYLPAPWYSPSRTVPNVGGLSTGFRPRGLRPLPRGYINLPADPLTGRSSRSRRFSSDIRTAPRSEHPGPTPSQFRTDFHQEPSVPNTRGALFGVAPDPSRSAGSYLPETTGAASVSGASSFRSRLERPARPERPERPGDVDVSDRTDGTLRSVPAGSPLDRLLNRPERSATTPDSARTPADVSPDPLRASRPPSTDEPARDAPTEAWSRSVRGGGPAKSERVGGEPTGDVYRTMLRAASSVESLSSSDRGEKGQPGASAQPPEGQDQAQTDDGKPAKPGPSIKRHQDEVREILSRPVLTFAGSAKTMGNDAHRRAESHLKAGEYYRAVSNYDVARVADPGNALAWIGRGHALIGAGDYLSAAASLEEGLTRFPKLARFRIDLKSFLDHRDILDIRRADLERRLAAREDYRLRFLLGYLEYYSGLEKFGRPNLKRAAEEAPTTSIIASFPNDLPEP